MFQYEHVTLTTAEVLRHTNEDVEFDLKNWNSSTVLLFMKSKWANFESVLLDQQEGLLPLYLTGVNVP